MTPLGYVSSLAAYAGLAAVVGAESSGVPVPGETTLLASAALAAHGQLTLPAVIAVAAGAAIVGDNVGYAIGARGGRWLLVRPGFGERRRRLLLARGESFFDRHGGKAVFLARWAPGLRVAGAWLAGAGRMRWRRFFLWNALGGITWATTVAGAGYFLGKAASVALGAAGVAVLAAIVLVAAGALAARRYRPGIRTGR